MPFWPPLLTVGDQFYESTSNIRNKLKVLFFTIFNKTGTNYLHLTPSDEVPCIESDRSIDPTTWEGQTAHHRAYGAGDFCSQTLIGKAVNSLTTMVTEDMRPFFYRA
jgi:hypothetical protein